jgi:hypothetical protein
MKRGIDMTIASGVMMLALLALIFYSSGKTTGLAVAASDAGDGMASFAACVYEKGATLYVSSGCPDCEEQKSLFGESFANIKSSFCEGECDGRSDITKFPTWIINGKKYEGKMTLEKLGELTGCRL